MEEDNKWLSSIRKEIDMLDPNMRIVGKQVYIRPITDSEEDTNNIIRWRNSDVVRPYFIYQKPFTVEGHRHWLETEVFTGKAFQFIVCQIEDDKPIGCTYLRDYDPVGRKAEYGMYIGEQVKKGRGIGTEILGLTQEFGFGELKLHKMFSRIFADNPASIHSVSNNGFVQEAYLKDEEFVNGEYRDIVYLAKINPGEVSK